MVGNGGTGGVGEGGNSALCPSTAPVGGEGDDGVPIISCKRHRFVNIFMISI